MGVRVPGTGTGSGVDAPVGGGRVEGELRHCFTFHYKDDRTNVWGDAWDCVWGGEIIPQPVSCLGEEGREKGWARCRGRAGGPCAKERTRVEEHVCVGLTDDIGACRPKADLSKHGRRRCGSEYGTDQSR